MHEYGAISLIPTVIVLALAIWSHRTIESVIVGSEHIEMTDTYASSDDHSASVSLFFVSIAAGLSALGFLIVAL